MFVGGLRLSTAESQVSLSFIGDFFLRMNMYNVTGETVSFLQRHPSLSFLPVFFLSNRISLSRVPYFPFHFHLFVCFLIVCASHIPHSPFDQFL